jgi:hypothetical protein
MPDEAPHGRLVFPGHEMDHERHGPASPPVLTQAPFLAIPGQVAYAIGNDPVITANHCHLKLIEVRIDGCICVTGARLAILSSLHNQLT